MQKFEEQQHNQLQIKGCMIKKKKKVDQRKTTLRSPAFLRLKLQQNHLWRGANKWWLHAEEAYSVQSRDSTHQGGNGRMKP